MARLDKEYESVLLTDGLTETVQVVSAPASASAITNLQEAGVDEGGLVKRHGDHLVILRRGRLFTVAIGAGELRAVSSIDAFDPRITTKSPDDWTWYDELLISGDTIAVLGYSYDRGGTEIGLFDIDAEGGLQHRSTYHLRSNDYYSAENSASRLIGSRLIVYTPLAFDGEAERSRGLPELRKWTPSAADDQFERIAAGSRVYRPVQRLDGSSHVVLHSVTACDLAQPELSCEATVVIGGPQTAFYVSPSAVYVWAADASGESTSTSMLYRIPVDGLPPTAARVRGTPFNQFSFFESGDRFLNVVTRGAVRGRGNPAGGIDLALLRIALDRLGDGSASAPESAYTALGRCDNGWLENRFIGAAALVSCSRFGKMGENSAESVVSVVQWATRESVQLTVPLSVSRIEPMGDHALVVGPADGNWMDLRFGSIRLGGMPALATTFTLSGSAETEVRSHAFGYFAENATDGLLGLPIVNQSGRDGARERAESGAIVFLRSRSLALEDAGALGAGTMVSDDGCRASCADWYGNARPLFVGARVFALLGYEIVEGEVLGGRVMETGRATFLPQGPDVRR